VLSMAQRRYLNPVSPWTTGTAWSCRRSCGISPLWASAFCSSTASLEVFPPQEFAENECHHDPESEAGERYAIRVPVSRSPHRRPNIRASNVAEL
jgi:hypothetical protein